MQYSDKPITRPAQDLLGRAGFALKLAQAIDTLAIAQDGFVIAIHGGWGSGKSSVIELIIRYLRHIEMERASQGPILDDPQPRPFSIAQLDEMAETFQLVASNVDALEQS